MSNFTTRSLALLATTTALAVPSAATAAPVATEVDTGIAAFDLLTPQLAETGAITVATYGPGYQTYDVLRYRAGRVVALKGVDGKTGTNTSYAGNRIGATIGASRVLPYPQSESVTTVPTVWLPWLDRAVRLPGSKPGDFPQFINDVGQTFVTAGDDRSPFLLSPRGQRTPVSYLPGLPDAIADVRSLNDRGQLLFTGPRNGSDYASSGIWQGGKVTDVGPITALPGIPAGTPPSQISVSASDMNERGEVIGYTNAFPNEQQYAFFRSASGKITVIGDPEHQSGFDQLLNERGHGTWSAIGSETPHALSHVALWTGGTTFRDLGVGSPTAINARDQIVGTGASPDPARGFFWSEATGMVELRTAIPGATAVLPTAINELGVIVGVVTAPDGKHVVRWTVKR